MYGFYDNKDKLIDLVAGFNMENAKERFEEEHPGTEYKYENVLY